MRNLLALLLFLCVSVNSLFTTESLHKRGGKVYSENATGVSTASVIFLVALHASSELSEHLQGNPSGD